MYGGSGEIRTHGPLSEPAVFKTAAISRTRPHFRISKLGVGDRTRTCIIRICNPAPSHSAHTYINTLKLRCFDIHNRQAKQLPVIDQSIDQILHQEHP